MTVYNRIMQDHFIGYNYNIHSNHWTSTIFIRFLTWILAVPASGVDHNGLRMFSETSSRTVPQLRRGCCWILTVKEWNMKLVDSDLSGQNLFFLFTGMFRCECFLSWYDNRICIEAGIIQYKQKDPQIGHVHESAILWTMEMLEESRHSVLCLLEWTSQKMDFSQRGQKTMARLVISDVQHCIAFRWKSSHKLSHYVWVVLTHTCRKPHGCSIPQPDIGISNLLDL
jgi:hypothetical protein